MLKLVESFEKLKKISIAKYKVIIKEEDLKEFGFPCYLKVSAPIHKTDEGGVIKCNDFEQAKKEYQKLKKKFKNFEIIVQEAIEGIEMIIGVKQDEVFDRVLMVGFGGIHAESIKDVSFRAIPVDKAEIKNMLLELKGSESLYKRKKYAIKKLIKLIEKVSKINVDEMDLNPVIVNEKKAIVVDARVGLVEDN